MKKRKSGLFFSFPAEVALGGVLVSVYAGTGATIQNYNAFLACGSDMMRLDTPQGVVRIEGEGMDIAGMHKGCVDILGKINCVCFEGHGA